MIDIRTTRPDGGLQTTTSGSSFPGLPGAGGGGLGANMDFFRDLAMRGIALKEQMARQALAERQQSAANALEDRSQSRNAAQRASLSNAGFQFTHSRPDLESGMASPADYNQNTGVGLRSPITSSYGPGGGIEDYADAVDRKRRQAQADTDASKTAGYFG